ncbi:KTSC domain-containing protein [Tyzzerella sp. An114]|uniref:KTSC domain-containing protein n=1 Tax=Tyzzerella sp. An114 TaxID=1965545 RepID=UPI000B42FDB9|nr:KTSC domain-containing protein [Tyzzerella sp. An114]OUQ56208.1 KTSC domain-containing protein [Tyzzerella sp. An114]
MNMIPVNSSNISKIGYENGTLYVEFKTRSLYAYNNVPIEVYNALMSASSHGKYLASHIKGLYSYQKLY